MGWSAAIRNGDFSPGTAVLLLCPFAAVMTSVSNYRAYCARNGEFTRSTTEFYTALENAGFLRKKTKSGNVIMGLQLKSDFGE